MANRSCHDIQTPKDNVVLLTAQVTGAAGANLALPELGNLGGGEIKSNTRTGTGTFTIAWRFSYPQLLGGSEPLVVGTTAGLRARFSAIDVKAQTATLVFEVGAVATDPAATDSAYIALYVRNSGRNK